MQGCPIPRSLRAIDPLVADVQQTLHESRESARLELAGAYDDPRRADHARRLAADAPVEQPTEELLAVQL